MQVNRYAGDQVNRRPVSKCKAEFWPHFWGTDDTLSVELQCSQVVLGHKLFIALEDGGGSDGAREKYVPPLPPYFRIT